ncbi:MAG: OmpA family protein, partial [Pseudomonadota bacterium]
SNGDGVVDNFLDDDGNGIDDGVQAVPFGTVDTDNDNIPDFQDLDSDNEGRSDLQESGGIDSNGDGAADSLVIASALPDENGDGIPDFQEVIANASNLQQAAAIDGPILTGLDGSGCTLNGQSRGVDPLLPGLLIFAMLYCVRRRLTITLLLLPLVLAGPGQAQSLDGLAAEDKLRFGVYTGIGLGISRLEPDTRLANGWDPNDRMNYGGQVNLGVDVSKHFALELHSADLGSAGLSPTGRINYHTQGISALFYSGKNRHRYKRRGLTTFVRGGVGALSNSPVGEVPFRKVNATHMLFGAGLEYMHRRGLGGRLELISFDTDVQYGQFSLIYRFGQRRYQRIAQSPVVKEPVVAAAKTEPLPAAIPPPPPPPVIAPSPPAVAPVIAKTDLCRRISGILRGVKFNTDSDVLSEVAERALDKISRALLTCPDSPITISAHTDSRGSHEYNRDLSARRALSVVKYLTDSGVALKRMSAYEYGETRPIDTNETAEGRRNNRRVELAVSSATLR